MKKVVSCLVQLSINPGGQRPPNARVFRICNVSLLPKLPRYEGNSIEHCIDLAKTGAALARMDQDFERAHPKRDRPAYVVKCDIGTSGHSRCLVRHVQRAEQSNVSPFGF